MQPKCCTTKKSFKLNFFKTEVQAPNDIRARVCDCARFLEKIKCIFPFFFFKYISNIRGENSEH